MEIGKSYVYFSDNAFIIRGLEEVVCFMHKFTKLSIITRAKMSANGTETDNIISMQNEKERRLVPGPKLDHAMLSHGDAVYPDAGMINDDSEFTETDVFHTETLSSQLKEDNVSGTM